MPIGLAKGSRANKSYLQYIRERNRLMCTYKHKGVGLCQYVYYSAGFYVQDLQGQLPINNKQEHAF